LSGILTDNWDSLVFSMQFLKLFANLLHTWVVYLKRSYLFCSFELFAKLLFIYCFAHCDICKKPLYGATIFPSPSIQTGEYVYPLTVYGTAHWISSTWVSGLSLSSPLIAHLMTLALFVFITGTLWHMFLYYHLQTSSDIHHPSFDWQPHFVLGWCIFSEHTTLYSPLIPVTDWDTHSYFVRKIEPYTYYIPSVEQINQ
jgi:hypothetical protein